MSNPPKLSDVERIKAASDHLRGTLAESLDNPVTGAIAVDDTTIIKFHGSYQQDDRDQREERRLARLEPAYSFMIRTRLPGGVCTPAQWLALDALATKYGSQSLRITTRQAFQLHGVIKRDLKPTMAAINAALIDSIAACGDVNRNVMCNPNPVDSTVHAEVYEWSRKLSEHLLPRTRAYYEVWLDEEKVAGSPSVEPLYGDTYLPRKFKVAIAVPPHNDVDVFANDLGFIAIIEDGVLLGFNVTVGGGLGATHGDPTTFPRVADVVGFIAPSQMLETASGVLAVQRDFGDRATRKYARLKYTIANRGLAWFVEELQARLGWKLAPARAYAFEHNGDRFGWNRGHDGAWHVTIHFDSGRVADTALTGLRAIAQIHRGDFRLTPNQNLVIANIAETARADIEALLTEHGLDTFARRSPIRLNALACVALPTCPLAMAEAERYLPEFIGKVETILERHGVQRERFHARITGCPNGCARPYLAEIALVGKAPGRYNLMLGGDTIGERLNTLYRENIDEPEILATLEPLVARYATERASEERFGDFVRRVKIVA